MRRESDSQQEVHSIYMPQSAAPHLRVSSLDIDRRGTFLQLRWPRRFRLVPSPTDSSLFLLLQGSSSVTVTIKQSAIFQATSALLLQIHETIS